jgi:hypothetical protein
VLTEYGRHTVTDSVRAAYIAYDRAWYETLTNADVRLVDHTTVGDRLRIIAMPRNVAKSAWGDTFRTPPVALTFGSLLRDKLLTAMCPL